MIKNILLHCRNDRRNRERVSLAVALARDHEAHLTGLYVRRLPGVVGGYPGLYICGEVLNGHRRAEEVAARACEAEFTAIMGRQDVPYKWPTEEGEGRGVSSPGTPGTPI